MSKRLLRRGGWDGGGRVGRRAGVGGGLGAGGEGEGRTRRRDMADKSTDCFVTLVPVADIHTSIMTPEYIQPRNPAF